MALQGITTQSLAAYLKPPRWPQLTLYLHRIKLDGDQVTDIKCLHVELTNGWLYATWQSWTKSSLHKNRCPKGKIRAFLGNMFIFNKITNTYSKLFPNTYPSLSFMTFNKKWQIQDNSFYNIHSTTFIIQLNKINSDIITIPVFWHSFSDHSYCSSNKYKLCILSSVPGVFHFVHKPRNTPLK